MALTNFPNGITSFGVPMIGGDLPIVPSTGNYWFVDSVHGSNGNPGSFDAPFASLSTAITAASANDIIVLSAGHAETISTAAGIAVSKNGLQIFGEGSGNQRPTFTFATSAAATMTIAGNGVSIQNIVATTTVDQIVSPFVVSGSNVSLGIEWRDGSSVLEALRAILTTATADFLTVNLKYTGFTGGSHGVNAIRLVGCDTGRINVDYYGVCTTAVVEFVTTACTNIDITGTFYVSGTTNLSKNVVDTVTGSTWYANAWDAAAGIPFSGGSGAAVSGANQSLQEQVATSATAVMVNGNTLFTVAGGAIKVEALYSICVSGNNGTASTLQYSVTPTVGAGSTTISAASASLASAAAGATVTLAGTALATAALLSANGPNLIANPGTILVPAGTITAVIGVGSTTGTWKHVIRYKPLAVGVTVT
jgi:hypothetical protein